MLLPVLEVPALFQPQGNVKPRPGPSGGGLSVAAPYKLHGGNSTIRSLHECTKREYAKDVLRSRALLGLGLHVCPPQVKVEG